MNAKTSHSVLLDISFHDR